MQVFEELGDLRIVAVAVLELQSQAFGERTREDARRIECLQRRQNALHHRHGCAELQAELGEIGVQISGFVDEVDQVLGNETFGRIPEREMELLDEMILERSLIGDIGLEVGILAVERVCALAKRGPARYSGIRLHVGGGRIGEHIFEFSVERARGIADRFGEIQPFLAVHTVRFTVLGIGRLAWRLIFGRCFALVVALEQRISFELPLDVIGQLHVGQLQETDGLLQLWCHHQLLALSQLQFCRKCHKPNLRRPNRRTRGQV